MPMADCAARLRRFCDTFDLCHKRMSGNIPVKRDLPDIYTVRCDPAATGIDHGIFSLKVLRFGRFANNVMQVANAIHIASEIGASVIDVSDLKLFGAPSYRLDNGLIIANGKADEIRGPALCGHFFYRHSLAPLFAKLTTDKRLKILRDDIRPMLELPDPGEHNKSGLVLHLRGGDCFSRRPHPSYVQPPLQFYLKAISHACNIDPASNYTVVHEDFKNPALKPLLKSFARRSISIQSQSSSLMADVARLAAARTLIVSNSSFAEVSGLLSDNLRSIYAFRKIFLGPEFIARGVKVYMIDDLGGRYGEHGQWQNSLWQRRRINAYPADHLSAPHEYRTDIAIEP